MKRLLPRAVALEGLSRLVPDSKLALQLLEYWLRRRQQEGGPLLARLWFEQPWKVRRQQQHQQLLLRGSAVSPQTEMLLALSCKANLYAPNPAPCDTGLLIA
jgi:hypothetical protein